MRSPRRNLRKFVGLRQLLLFALSAYLFAVLAPTGCATMTAEQTRRWGCIAGTFLSVAADNFGARYLHDASRIVSLFANPQMAGEFPSSGVGCAPSPGEGRPFNSGSAAYGAPPSAGQYASSDEYPQQPEWSGQPQAPQYEPTSDAYYGSPAYGNGGSAPYYDQAAGNEPAQAPYYGPDYGPTQGGYDTQGAFADRPEFAAQATRPGEFALDVAFVRQSNADGRRIPTLMRDGEILRRAAGDTFQIVFAPTANAYVYVYTADSTAWIQRLFPDPARGHRNPVLGGQRVYLPRADYYFGLDEYEGKQEIWFLVSPQPRPDIAEALAAYPLDRKRPLPELGTSSNGPQYERISLPSVFARGLTEVGPGNVTPVWNDAGQPFSVTPARLFATPSAQEIAFSRWFEHR